MPLIITRQDYNYFVGTSELYRRESDKGKKSNIMELLLAKTLITRNLEEDWWNGASHEIDSWVKGSPLAVPAQHPVTKFLAEWGSKEASPATYGRMLGFALDLLDAIDQKDSNLDAKIPELESKSFFETWFEVHTASIFTRKGMPTKFIEESPREKRPDFSITYRDGKVLAECKLRAKLSPEERSSERIFRKRIDARLASVEALLNDASGKVSSPTVPYLIALGIEEPLPTVSSSLERKLLRSLIETFLLRNTNVTALIVLSEHWFNDGDFVQFQTGISCIPSTLPDRILPDDFYRVLVDSKVNSRPRIESLSEYALKH